MTRELTRAPALIKQARRRATAAWTRFDRERGRTRRLDPGVIDVEFEPVTLQTRDGLELAGWYLPGARRAGAPLVVLHHHFGGQRATTLPWLALLDQLGLAAVVFDGRGHGDSPAPPDGAQHLVARIRDVEAALELGRRRGHRRFIGLGQSQGAAVITMTLGHRPDVDALVLDSGPSPDMGLASWGLARRMVDAVVGSGPGAEAGAGEQRLAQALVAFEVWRRGAALRYAARLWSALFASRRRPLLWIHSDDDDVIPRAHARLWYGPLASELWRELRLVGPGHCESASAEPERLLEAMGRLFG